MRGGRAGEPPAWRGVRRRSRAGLLTVALLAGAGSGRLAGQSTSPLRPPLPDPRLAAPVAPRRGALTPPLAADTTPFCCGRRHFAPLVADVAGLEILPWYFNRYFADDSTALRSTQSWKVNVERGFTWDRDHFRTNMFLHPFHGSAYFNAARSNGYSFWQSAAFPWLGSFLWEFLGERNRPSINDWVNTSAGGVIIGEALFRASRVVRDNRATGSDRTFRELGAFFLDPVGAVNRLFRGEMTRVGPNPEDRLPAAFGIAAKAGFRFVGHGNLDLENGGAAPFLEFAVQYGDPYRPIREPFEDFLATVQLNGKDKEALGRLQVEGPLYRTLIARTEHGSFLFGLDLDYDYINNETYELGGQSVGASLLSQLRLSDRWTLHARAQLVGTLIAGIDSEYANVTGRNYDFGSGAGLRIYCDLYRGGDMLLQAFYVGAWIHTLNGTAGDYVIHFPDLMARVPVLRPFGLGVELILAARESHYDDFPDVNRHNPQFRIFTTLMPASRERP